MNIKEIAIVVTICLVLIVVSVQTFTTWQDCKESGGVLLRGAFALECLKR